MSGCSMDMPARGGPITSVLRRCYPPSSVLNRQALFVLCANHCAHFNVQTNTFAGGEIAGFLAPMPRGPGLLSQRPTITMSPSPVWID